MTRGKPSDVADEVIRRADTIYVSTISLAEIAIKNSKKPYLPRPFNQFMDELTAHPDYQIIGFSEHAARVLHRLPFHHKDPFDRMLVSLALSEGFTLLTNDQAIHEYTVPQLW